MNSYDLLIELADDLARVGRVETRPPNLKGDVVTRVDPLVGRPFALVEGGPDRNSYATMSLPFPLGNIVVRPDGVVLPPARQPVVLQLLRVNGKLGRQ